MTDASHYNCLFNNTISIADIKRRAIQQLTKCAIYGCEWTDVLAKLPKHFDTNHPRNLLDFSNPTGNIVINLDNPIVLALQFKRNKCSNEAYWIRLYNMNNNRYIIMMHIGNIGNGDTSHLKFNEFIVSSVSCPNHSIRNDVLCNSQKFDICDNEFIKDKGTRITALEGNEYNITAENKSSIGTATDFILEQLECFICVNLMTPPIRVCINGHSICSQCFLKVKECPRCKGKMSQARNYTMERIIHNLKDVFCINRSAGCTVTGTPEELELHVDCCTFQMTRCMLIGCSWSGLYDHVLDHWKDKHTNRIIGNDLPFMSLSCTYLCTESKNNFILASTFHDNNIYYSVHHLTPTKKSNFNFNLKISHHITGTFVTFSGSCTPSTGQDVRDSTYLYTVGENCQVTLTNYFSDLYDTFSGVKTTLSLKNNNNF